MPNYYPPASGGAGGGGTPDDNSVTSAKIADGAIVDADVNASAAIALSKLASNPLARANHTGTQLLATISDAGTLAALSAVASAQITDGTIVGGDLSGTIALPNGTTATTQTAADNSTKPATTAYVDTADALKANLAGPTFTGVVTLPTGAVGTSQTVADRSTKVSTTLYADRAAENAIVGWSNPTGALAATYPRVGVALTTRTAITAILYMDAIYIPSGTVISNFNAISSATASSCTHAWCALFNNSRVQLAATADDTSGNGGWTADTTKTQPVATIASGASATFTTTYSGLHYVGICTVFTGTAPAIRGDAAATAIVNTLPPIIAGPSNGSQSTPNAFAFTANALTPSGTHDYVWLT